MTWSSRKRRRYWFSSAFRGTYSAKHFELEAVQKLECQKAWKTQPENPYEKIAQTWEAQNMMLYLSEMCSLFDFIQKSVLYLSIDMRVEKCVER